MAKTREAFKPLGIIQKGRSRFWYDDKDWYGVIVGFEPTKSRKGTYMKVGVAWHWYPKDYWSYDLVVEDAGFVQYQSDEQFTIEMMSLIKRVLNQLEVTNSGCSTFNGAYEYAFSYFNQSDGWSSLNQGMLALLSGKIQEGIRLIKSVEQLEVKYEWQEKRHQYCNEALENAHDLNQFKTWVEGQIHLSRNMKKLPERPINLGII